MKNSKMADSIKKYRQIYNKEVLPNKSVKTSSHETCHETIKVFEDFAPFRKRANEEVLGGEKHERR
jgi:hypothetical protein